MVRSHPQKTASHRCRITVVLAILVLALATPPAARADDSVRLARATWDTGWFSLNEQYLEHVADRDAAARVGHAVRGGALEGYLVDRATVEQIQGDYSPMMVEMADRFGRGEPLLFYTWTPSWTVGRLVSGRHAIWLEVPPITGTRPEPAPAIADVPGVDRPLRLGWPPNDIRIVAHRPFLDANPAIRALLERIEIPIADIHRQNSRMMRGEDAPTDFGRHAREWIDRHQDTVGDGDKTPRRSLGKAFTLLWMFAYFTASVASSFAASELPAIEPAIDQFETGEVDAVVYDAPVLQHHASHTGRGHVHVVGPVFWQQQYNIALAADSPLRDPINQALLRRMEGDEYERIQRRRLERDPASGGTE